MTRSILKALMKPIASRFIVKSERDALDLADRLKTKYGFKATIAQIGETSLKTLDTIYYTEACIGSIYNIMNHDADINVSVKLTSLGMPQYENLLQNNFRRIMEVAAERNVFVRIDMEKAEYIYDTLRLYDNYRYEYDNRGICLQARLHRTIDDVEELCESSLQANVRLCKGAYKDREGSFRDEEVVEANFMNCLEVLREEGNVIAVATSDEYLIEQSKEFMGKDFDEFQFLYGASAPAVDLAKEGYNVRIYIPYGKNWYKYVVRRIQEDPSILKLIFKRRGVR